MNDMKNMVAMMHETNMMKKTKRKNDMKNIMKKVNTKNDMKNMSTVVMMITDTNMTIRMEHSTIEQ